MTPPRPMPPWVGLLGFAFLTLWLALSIVLARRSPLAGLLCSALPLLAFGSWLRGRVLLFLAVRRLASSGVRVIVVYASTSRWAPRIQREWLAPLGSRAVIVDRSRGEHRSGSLAARLWRHFGPGRRDVSPAVLVLRGPREPRLLLFHGPLRLAARGDTSALDALEREHLAVREAG